MYVIMYLLYAALGVFQLLATIAGFEHWLGIHWILAAIVALFLAWIPVIGTIAGVMGAHHAWGWSWMSSIFLFFGPQVVVLVLFLIAAAADKARARAS